MMMQSTLNTQNELPNAGPGTNRQHDFLPKPESELETNSALAVLSWNELQSCFSVAMEQRSQAEMLLQQETAEILETIAAHDEGRAFKRFKTRRDFTEDSIAKLEEKKKHCQFPRPVGFQPVLLTMERCKRGPGISAGTGPVAR